MRKKIGFGCMILGVLLIVSAFSLLVWNREADRRAAEASERVLPEVKQAMEEQWIAETAPEEEAPKGPLTAEIDGYAYIGILSIPALDLELPVMDEWDYDRLKLAPCLYFGSPEEDDMVIAAHNYSRHFGRLSRLKAGDLVIFQNMEGVVYTYEVGCIETLAPEDTEAMLESGWDLTLYTCTYGGANRVTVRCDRI